MHHIISDGTSLAIFVDELCKLYNGESLSELKITYKDFAVFEANCLASGKLQDAEKYWLNQFEEDIPPIPGILQARTLEWVAISFSNA